MDFYCNQKRNGNGGVMSANNWIFTSIEYAFIRIAQLMNNNYSTHLLRVQFKLHSNNFTDFWICVSSLWQRSVYTFLIRFRRIFMRHETLLICSFHFQRWRDNCAKSFIRREQCAEKKNIVQNEVNSVGNVCNVPLTFIWQLTQIIIILLRSLSLDERRALGWEWGETEN